MQPNDIPETLDRGRYKVERLLGTGGTASVYLATDTRMGVQRAIKVLHTDFARSRQNRARFLTEAQAQAALKHPNVLMVHDVLDDDQGLYMVMELAESDSLGQRVSKLGTLSPKATAEVGIFVGGALAAAHDAGVIHRDIKPANILMDRHGVLKVADFGIARLASREVSLTRTGTVMGTWAYMPPEQREDTTQADARADIYALGVTLHALLTGRNSSNLHNRELYETAFAGVPEPLAKVIQKATRLFPEDRYQTSRELVEALKAIVEDLPGASLEEGHEAERTDPDGLALMGTSSAVFSRLSAPTGATALPEKALGAGNRTQDTWLTEPGDESAVAPAGGGTIVPTADDQDTRLLPPSAAEAAAGVQPAPAAPVPAAEPAPAEEPAPATGGGSLPVLLLAGALMFALVAGGGFLVIPRLLDRGDPTPAPASTAPAAPHPTPSPAATEPAPGTGADEAATDAEAAHAAQAAASEPEGAPASSPRKPKRRTIRVIPGAGSSSGGASAGATPAPEATAPSGRTGVVRVRTIPSGATVLHRGSAVPRESNGDYILPVGTQVLQLRHGDEVHDVPVSVTESRAASVCYNFDENASCMPL